MAQDAEIKGLSVFSDSADGQPFRFIQRSPAVAAEKHIKKRVYLRQPLGKQDFINIPDIC
jgi:hypothetical protein